jgi:hypothetical protein
VIAFVAAIGSLSTMRDKWYGFAPLPAALDRRGDRRKPLHPRRAYVYAVGEHGRHMAMDRLAKDEACHVAAHFAKLPELLKRPPQ